MNLRSKSERPLKERLREAAREEILQAAERVFGTRGLEAAKMEEVALAAGVSVGTLYNHFHDRESLVNALLDARRNEVLTRVDEVLRGPGGFEEQLRALVQAVMDHFSRHGQLFSMLVEDEVRRGRTGAARAKPALKELAQRVDALVKRGVSEGALRKDDAELFPSFLIGLVRGSFARLVHTGKTEPEPKLTDALVTMFLKGAGVKR